MSKIFWLASYPKSGNTWVRILLTNYLHAQDTPAHINQLQGGPIASSRMWFDEWAGIEASELSDAVIERLRPDVYACMAKDTPEPLYMKVHDCWRCTDTGKSVFPPEVTGGVIYILRNPLDMAASVAHHYGLDIDGAIDSMNDPDYALARSLGGTSDQLRQPLSSWSGHVQSWVDQSALPLHILRYEDLKRAPGKTFADVVRFCGLPFDEERVRQAVKFSAFAALKEQETRDGFREASYKAPDNFFRKGEAGAWREELTPSQVQRLASAHATVMRRFGYLDENNQPL